MGTGDVVMNRVLAEATATDLKSLVPIVFLVIVVSSALLLKSIFDSAVAPATDSL